MGLGDWIFLACVAPPTLACVGALAATVWTILGVRRLADVTPRPQGDWPRISFIVPACDEGATIGPALESLLALDYPNLRIVVVDDRSTDDTGAILDAFAARDPRVVAVHVRELPDGWLGKLNAMAHGVAHAGDAEWLLFADADVEFSTSALRKAMTLCLEGELDMLTALPEVRPAGFLADATINVTGWILAFASRMPRVRDPKSSAVAGVGAFILARRIAFDRTPGLAWLKLEVADDVGLGLMMKTHGARCDVVQARGELRLQWYASYRDMAVKMQKNYFAILSRFSLARAAVQAATMIALALFPLAWLVPHRPALDVVLALGLASLTAGTLLGAAWLGRPLVPALVPQLGLLGQAALIVRAAVVGRRLAGIAWRGKLYPTTLLAPAQRVKI